MYRPTLTAIALVATLAATASTLAAAADGPTVAIIAGTEPLTMINVLTPNDGTSLDELVDSLTTGLGEYVSTFPGFVSAAVHKSLDDSYAVVYAKWTDEAAVDGAVQRIMGGEAPPMAAAFTMSSPEFHPYEVVEVIEAQAR